MKFIEGLNPNQLWKRFYEISQIPRASKSEERIRLYLKNFAGSNNLLLSEDETGNIVMNVPATPGKEHYPTIVLQGHVDMVCEKNRDTVHDFSQDPIRLIRAGEWIKADGTTLGADNGIGVAAALAIATDEDFEHGPLELLFTVDEETGLTGANGLKPGFINGKILLNLDTEEDGAFYVGCAGGMDSAGIIKPEFENINSDYQPYSIFITGLKGGHSGINIIERRANAIKLLAQLLDRVSSLQFQTVHLNGGSKRNAIPREAEVLIFTSPDSESEFREVINEFALEAALEYKDSDADIKISMEGRSFTSIKHLSAFTKSFTNKLVNILLAMPHGVVSMSPTIPGLVETSTNLATLTFNETEIIIGTSQRSSIESCKKNIARSVSSVFELGNARVKVTDGYPGWQPNINSDILKTAQKVFREMFSKDANIKAVHAGLECGILGDKYPGLDMISLGPTIEGAHSPDEKVNITDVEKFYRLLKKIITEVKPI